MAAETTEAAIPSAEVAETPATDAEEEDVTDDREEDEWDSVQAPPKDEDDGLVPSAPDTDGEEKFVDEVDESEIEQPYKPRPPPSVDDSVDGRPDFSKYTTNVAERLWRAKNKAKESGVTASPDLVPLAREYQTWRKKMGLLNRYIDEYQAAMKEVTAKRHQVMQQYVLLSEDTPLWNHVGKALTDEQVSEIETSGDMKTLEGIQLRTEAITKVADDIGPGSLMAHQQLAKMQDELNQVEYKTHIVDYIDEWDEVVTSKLDADVKSVRELAKQREYYINKVDLLREKVNKIERKGKKIAPKKMSDQLDRNEKRLVDIDNLYEKKANQVSVELFEATTRGWVDYYPVLKNVMKFEVNRLGRESSTYGSLHSTLTELKSDYREATKNTADAPIAGSAL
mmetsp:Transcript_17146/g.39407  ORF Transcript_17146/g.39407 Transcript_17146/m.39407 type:complete len:396 (+) Transcript_17146:82-1269(+)|eukprot:CAMPEP_0172397148 /NCGR_PEP_ID=MMETSP1061-20121228/29309_1 /TAXON_ID=37318 /ORGANISM="Pseudo-nitzschia pungens, Strain cf. pungens" /LENGTH=395 /DNA_ID=CAMNT_0013129235 /DNA_START=40 /DNA_END=1230 /DNA_ORIENTATION=-